MSTARRALALAATAALALSLPAVAWACPACAGRDEAGLGYFLAMAAMIGFPFGVVALVVTLLRRGPSAPRA